MNVPFNDLSRIHKPLQEEFRQAFDRVTANSRYIQGEETRLFEQNFARYLGVAYCIGCGNGTDALEIIFRALEIGSGDEVIVPANTYIATAEAVVNADARPVFADVDPERFTITAQEIHRLVNARTRAVAPVHLYGCPAEMDEIREVARRFGLYVVADCAQAHGAEYRGVKTGGLCDAAAFSFYPTKNLGALGDGGAITTNNKALAEKCRMIANHGQLARDNHTMAGRNSRLDEIQAAFLNVKLKRLDGWNEERAKLAAHYIREITHPEVTAPHFPPDSRHACHLFVVQAANRKKLIRRLDNAGVQTLIHYPQILPELPPFHRFSDGEKYNAKRLSQRVVSIPLFPGMRPEEMDRVVTAINGLR